MAAAYQLDAFELLARAVDSLIGGMLMYGDGTEADYAACIEAIRARVPEMVEVFEAAYLTWA